MILLKVAMATAKRVKRKRLYSYRVWFKDGTDVVIKAESLGAAYDMFDVARRMQIREIVDAV